MKICHIVLGAVPVAEPRRGGGGNGGLPFLKTHIFLHSIFLLKSLAFQPLQHSGLTPFYRGRQAKDSGM